MLRRGEPSFWRIVSRTRRRFALVTFAVLVIWRRTTKNPVRTSTTLSQYQSSVRKRTCTSCRFPSIRSISRCPRALILIPPLRRSGGMFCVRCSTLCLPRNAAHARRLIPMVRCCRMWYPESRAMGTSESSTSRVWRKYSAISSTGTTRLNAPPSSTSSSSLLCAPRFVRNRCFCAHGTLGRSLSSVCHTPGSAAFSSASSSRSFASTPAITAATSSLENLCCLI